MMQGFCHIYTGDGKGKTTAAFGLAIRAACSGKSVFIGQFIKDMAYEETKIGKILKEIHIEQMGLGCIFDREPSPEEYEIAVAALKRCKDLLAEGAYDVVILDEITIAVYLGLISEEAVLDALKARAAHVEVVLTGRYATEGLIDYADLVTEMKEIKHYYQQGVISRKGIDC